MSNKKLTISHLCQQIEYISIKQIVYWINKRINYLAQKLWLVICWKCNFMHGPAKLFTILRFIMYTCRSGMHKEKKFYTVKNLHKEQQYLHLELQIWLLHKQGLRDYEKNQRQVEDGHYVSKWKQLFSIVNDK